MSVAHSIHNVKRVSRKRNTHDQISASMAMFAPSPYLNPRVSQIKLTPNRGTIRALLDLELLLEGVPMFDIRNVKIIQQGDKKPWVQLPHQKALDGNWYPVIRCLDGKLKLKIKWKALRAYSMEERMARKNKSQEVTA